MGRLNIVEDDDDVKSVKTERPNAVLNAASVSASVSNSAKSSHHRDQPDVSRKKCISDESGYFEGTEDLLPGESGSIEILFEKAVSGNNNFKTTRLPVPSPALSPVTAESSSSAASAGNRPELPPSTSKGRSTASTHQHYCYSHITATATLQLLPLYNYSYIAASATLQLQFISISS